MKQCNLVEDNKTLVLLTLTTRKLVRYFKPAYATKSKAIDSNMIYVLAYFFGLLNPIKFFLSPERKKRILRDK